MGVQKSVQIHPGQVECLIAECPEFRGGLHPQRCHHQLFIEVLSRVGLSFLSLHLHRGCRNKNSGSQHQGQQQPQTVSIFSHHRISINGVLIFLPFPHD